ncbi:hypothetical protein CTQ59_001673 [Salmonella enterica subsp. arizonae]|nr:hypothetical protein [Salmonella enterica subsp. arizonae]
MLQTLNAERPILAQTDNYDIVDFFSSIYDEAMTDEALRLAYVAVTRGVKRVFWFAPQKSSGAYHTMKTACVRAGKLQ